MRRRDGKDRYHDYLYHNLGQSLRFLDTAGRPLATTPSARLAFADGDLIGYDYWHDRASLTSHAPLQARFDLALPGKQRTVVATGFSGLGFKIAPASAEAAVALAFGEPATDVSSFHPGRFVPA